MLIIIYYSYKYNYTSIEKLVRIHKYVYSASVFTLSSNKEMILQEPMTKCRVTDSSISQKYVKKFL